MPQSIYDVSRVQGFISWNGTKIALLETMEHI